MDSHGPTAWYVVATCVRLAVAVVQGLTLYFPWMNLPIWEFGRPSMNLSNIECHHKYGTHEMNLIQYLHIYTNLFGPQRARIAFIPCTTFQCIYIHGMQSDACMWSNQHVMYMYTEYSRILVKFLDLRNSFWTAINPYTGPWVKCALLKPISALAMARAGSHVDLQALRTIPAFSRIFPRSPGPATSHVNIRRAQAAWSAC